MLRQQYLKRFTISLTIAAMIAYLLMSGLLSAQWSVYVDHDIVVHLGDDRKVHVEEVLPLVLETEVGYPGETTRYRPTYYLSWVLESFLWGDSPRSWYRARILFLAIFLSGVIFWLQRSTGWFCAAGLTTLLSATPGFRAVWIGLGNGEQYFSAFGALYFLLLSYAAYHVTETKSMRLRACWLGILILGLWVIGIKENMVVMVAPPVALTVFQAWRLRRTDYWSLTVSALLTLYTVGIVLAVSTGILAQQSDFYGTAITPTERISSVFKYLLSLPLVVPSSIISIMTIALLIPLNEATKRALMVAWRPLIILYGGLLLHVIFYNGWPTNSRYSSPGELLLFAFMVVTIGNIPHIFGWQIHRNYQRVLVLSGVVPWLVFAFHSLPSMHRDIAAFVSRSQQYTATLAEITMAARENLARPIIFKSAHPADFEAIFAVNRFLKYSGTSNALILDNLPIVEPYPSQDFFAQLRSVLETLAVSGEDVPIGAAGTLPSRYGAVFTPKHLAPSDAGCIAVFFQRAMDNSACEKVFRVTY
jgi:hypothetical protein